jgi:hypothetical protein
VCADGASSCRIATLLLLLLLLLQVVLVPNRGIWGTAGIGGANMDLHLHNSSSGPPQQVRCMFLLKKPCGLRPQSSAVSAVVCA